MIFKYFDRLEIPHFALGGVDEHLGAEEVGFWRVGKRAIIEKRQGFSDRGVPRLGLGDIQGRAGRHHRVNFFSRYEREAHTTMGGR